MISEIQFLGMIVEDQTGSDKTQEVECGQFLEGQKTLCVTILGLLD